MSTKMGSYLLLSICFVMSSTAMAAPDQANRASGGSLADTLQRQGSLSPGSKEDASWLKTILESFGGRVESSSGPGDPNDGGEGKLCSTGNWRRGICRKF